MFRYLFVFLLGIHFGNCSIQVSCIELEREMYGDDYGLDNVKNSQNYWGKPLDLRKKGSYITQQGVLNIVTSSTVICEINEYVIIWTTIVK